MANIAAAAPLQEQQSARVSFAKGVLHQFVETFKEFVDEVLVELDPANHEVRVKAVDPAHVAMLTVTLANPLVRVDAPGDARITLDIERLAQALPALSREDAYTIEWVPRGDESPLMRVTGLCPLVFEACAPHASSLQWPKAPKLSLSAKVDMTYDLFMVDDELGAAPFELASRIADHVQLETRDGELHVAAGDINDGRRVTYRLKDVQGGGKASYSLDYFRTLARAMLVWSDEFVFSFATDMPCEFRTADEGVCVRALLAPRLEPEAW